MRPLPLLMVAPNGARKTKSDHPALPLTLDEIVETAIDCHAAGADGLHLHVRNAGGGHILDVKLYQQAIVALTAAVPKVALQITTEAVGIYSPPEQRAIVETVRPDYVSISIAEMLSDGDYDSALKFYRACITQGIAVQHIVYGENDLRLLKSILNRGELPHEGLQLLFVLGRYTQDQQSSPANLHLFTNWLESNNITADWAVCAFGRGETACLKTALRAGGKVRVGFENSFFHADGSVARNNADRVAEISRLIM